MAHCCRRYARHACFWLQLIWRYGNQSHKYSNQGVSSNAAGKSTEPVQPPSTRSVGNRQGTPAEHNTGTTANPDIRAYNTQPPVDTLTYPLDSLTSVFASNYGIYGVRMELDPSLDAIHYYIVRFDQNGTQSWIPPLPPGSRLLSLYAGAGNRLYIAYAVQQPESQSFIAEVDFGDASQFKNIWKDGNLFIQKFVVGPQGLIYAAGYGDNFSKAVAKLTKGQSITTELMHIIDPATGEQRHLFPMTLRPRFDYPTWAGQTLLETISLVPSIAVKSNGNFFLTIDRNSAQASVRDLIKNEAVEYSPDGTVARTWKLGTLEPNSYLNKIFVDVDDSILAEIVRYPDTGAADSINGTIIDRYFLRVDLNARVTRYEPSFPIDEVIQGWTGQTRDLVTLVRGKQPVIRTHRLSPSINN